MTLTITAAWAFERSESDEGELLVMRRRCL